MRMLLSRFLEEIVSKYNLTALAINSWVYIEIRKGTYGLKHAGLTIWLLSITPHTGYVVT
jgi:hypothetical protein